MTNLIRDSIDGLLDLVYPPKCLSCQELDSNYICASCIAKIEPVDLPYCTRCGHTMSGPECRSCSGRVRSFTRARAAGKYSGVLRQLIHEFKYNGARCLAEPLSGIIYDYLSSASDFPWKKADCIVPVPIHAARKRVRGYNQSELLGQSLSLKTGLPMISDAVIRKVYTQPQVKLSREQRLVNMKSAFHVSKPESIKGRTALLIDDVSTTASTIHECSLELLSAGVDRIYVVCLAFDA
ncbi:MAG: double zinc ribbon domain-containing protein [Armatimonadota bacterium]